jgi:hypothetical protein
MSEGDATLPFHDVCEAIFTEKCPSRTWNNVVEEEDTQKGLFRGVQKMGEPIAVTAWVDDTVVIKTEGTSPCIEHVHVPVSKILRCYCFLES